METHPKLELNLQATHETYQSGTNEDMYLVVTATLNFPHPITLHNQGQWNSVSGTILCEVFRLNLFNWYDETADEVFQPPQNEDDEWGCEPGVFKVDCLELHPGKPLVITSLLDAVNPLCDPLVYAERKKDHVFRLKAKPQKLKWTRKMKSALFGEGGAEVPQEEYDTWEEIELVCEDIVKFMVNGN
ncbi:hypothetical protein BT63DRAFT_426775 [Microthyrium microscopicum]|uniref:Uncharacterized protein n=1 Tax=Microthyrium microscopicum TaxID=703497 RepID=A0A6A6UAJ3_9PEZI|nr:hypothetical protein BT63DRAFT_426775 [Microthyrium microscopicum]